MIDKEKVKVEELCKVIFDTPAYNHDDVITKWLKQNPVEPIVVGLSDEQVDTFVDYIQCQPEETHIDDVKRLCKALMKTQTFTQSDDIQDYLDEIAHLNKLNYEMNDSLEVCIKIKDEKTDEVTRLRKELEQLKSQFTPSWDGDDAPKDAAVAFIICEYLDDKNNHIRPRKIISEHKRPKHTPAPWEIEGSCIVGANTGVAIAAMICAPNFDLDEAKDIAHANAKLIAAAPDLLEILQIMADKDFEFSEYECRLARKAIAKARNNLDIL
jgi:uncharacterized FlaG/YvyC family protein